jgi:hypothetical protein
MTQEHMLTTSDNPYSPVTQFNEWRIWDQAAGYDTLGYLGRAVISSDDLSEADQSLAIEQAMDDIVADTGGFYVKVPVPENSNVVITSE